MKNFFILLFAIVFSTIITYYFFSFKKESNNNFLFFFNKNTNEGNYSSYKLDPIQIITSGDKKLSIELEVVIKYAYQDFFLEKEIIQKRMQIRKFIRNFISTKTYNQLSKTYQRESLKVEIVKGINLILTGKIIGIYYSSFIVI